ncbi:hypothetical protein KP509_10G048800 [Ceratopteris richardii]|uniref:non-specific serine/threonine protein kinase n=1 Tax=Ceratopteris richardii TaxID=49495 RepID=A0A8T2TV36_CERRI|nr:hypothetical protein KP509_10G048800 [Ceratopteris richardii]
MAALQAIQEAWAPTSFSWSGDPCESLWFGITCDQNGTSVIKLELPAQSLGGALPPQIGSLTSLQTLDLSYNTGIVGNLPSELFLLSNLVELFLQNCGLTGTIPDEIGNLRKLKYLALNQNSFTGTIPTTIGQLSEMFWLDFSYNQLSGNLPLALSNLTKAGHFHLQMNNFSGTIPVGIFAAKQPLVHLLLYSNSFDGPIPSDIGNLSSLDILRLDNNNFTSVPSSLMQLPTLTSLQLDHNNLTGDIVNVSSLTKLQSLYLGHNVFTSGPFPSWLLSFSNLSSLDIENGGLEGPVPASFFASPNLETVNLGYNHLNGTLDLSQANAALMDVNLQQNNITDLLEGTFNGSLNLQGNNICVSNPNIFNNACSGEVTSNAAPPSSCGCQIGYSPNPTAAAGSCLCSYPVSGIIVFTGLKVPLVPNTISVLQSSFVNNIPLLNSTDQVLMLVTSSTTLSASIYPNNTQVWDVTAANLIISLISSKSVLTDAVGPFLFFPTGPYNPLVSSRSSGLSGGAKAGIAAGVVISVLVIAGVAVYALLQRKRAEKAEKISKPFVLWKKKDGGPLKLKGARFFTLGEIKKITNNFSKAHEIGEGGFGKVYRATLPSGEEVAIKRLDARSQQGTTEFKNEIELLSRVHHKNLVNLVGFCLEEQMLIYEYLPNGTVQDSLSGKTSIRMDWPRRLQVALDSARGLAYLHNEADPSIFHRDIKSANILLDRNLVAKVADFGLSKFIVGGGEELDTQVKGTLGYLDPEYYATQRYTDKSDVYSFGVVILELITSRKPLEQGSFIVREVRTALQRGGLPAVRLSLVDAEVGKSCPDSQLSALLNLALRCVDESCESRPSMKQIVKELEDITAAYEGENDFDQHNYVSDFKGVDRSPKNESEDPLYDSSSFQYSGGYGVSATIEPK